MIYIVLLLLSFSNALQCWQCNENMNPENILIKLNSTKDMCVNFEDLGGPVNCSTSCYKNINKDVNNEYGTYF